MWLVLNIHWSGVLPALLVVPGETAMQVRIVCTPYCHAGAHCVYTILPCSCALCVHHTAMQLRIVCTPYCHAVAHCVYTLLPCRCALCVHHTAMQLSIVCTPYCHAVAHCVYTILQCSCALCVHHTAMQLRIVCTPYCHAGAHCAYTILPCRCALCVHPTAMQVRIVCTPYCHAGVHCVYTLLPCRCALCLHHTAMQVRVVRTPYCHAGAHCVYTILPCRCALCVHHTAMQVCIVCTPYCHTPYMNLKLCRTKTKQKYRLCWTTLTEITQVRTTKKGLIWHKMPPPALLQMKNNTCWACLNENKQMDRCSPDAVSNTISFLGTGKPKLNSKINPYISQTKQREEGKAKSESIEDWWREEHERKSHLKNNSNSLKDL